VLALTPHRLVLSALKPLEDGDGFLVRVLNPTDQPETACLSLGDALAVRVREAVQVRLDETREGGPIEREGGTFRFEVPPHALRSVRLR
jgi:alpha-mannosidase